MPLIENSRYSPPLFFMNGHIQTIYPALFRRVNGIRYVRERLRTPDRDFLDLDWSRVGTQKIAIISHGLEGNSQRAYVLGMVRVFNRNGWDALAWNFRGCSGEPNLKLRFYHSGETEDFRAVIAHVMARKIYLEIVLIGFSVGGNITLKYLGEEGDRVHPLIKKAVVFSVPCDLAASAQQISRPMNRMYLRRFLRMLRNKIRMKMRVMPGQISDGAFEKIKSFEDFDNRYVAPLHGFRDAWDYWSKASCKPYIERVSIPVLLVNALDDPFLAGSCYPVAEASANPLFFLEMPRSGGHVGFISFNHRGEYWSETRAMQFINNTGPDFLKFVQSRQERSSNL